MMGRRAVLLAGLLALVGSPMAHADAEVGALAPGFSVTDTRGRPYDLAALEGSYVVLEWFNNDCPFVNKHYASDNMQRLQQAYTAQGVVWLTIISSAPGRQGSVSAAEANAIQRDRHAAQTGIVLDPTGALGRLYGAKTTPHLFIISPAGVLIYAGAIDSEPSTDQADIASAVNYVQRALDEAMAGKPVSTPQTRPYGCSVKY